MKNTQIFPMFMSLTETEESSLCGAVSQVHYNTITYNKVKGSAAKLGVKKQIVQSTTKVLKTIKIAKVPELGLLNHIFSLLGF